MMTIVRLSLLEVKKIGSRPYSYLVLLVATFASIGMGVEVLSSDTFSMTHIFLFFAMIAEWIIIYYGAKSLGEEFSVKTSTIIFTKNVSRKIILLSKLTSLALIGLMMGIISSSIAVIFQYLLTGNLTGEFLIKEALFNTIAYILFTMLVGSFGILVASLTMNLTTALLISIVAFQFLPALLEMTVEKFSFLKGGMEYIPFHSAIKFLELHQFGTATLFGIIGGIILFTVCSVILIDNKDLV